jgi:hypothetical protein
MTIGRSKPGKRTLNSSPKRRLQDSIKAIGRASQRIICTAGGSVGPEEGAHLQRVTDWAQTQIQRDTKQPTTTAGRQRAGLRVLFAANPGCSRATSRRTTDLRAMTPWRQGRQRAQAEPR